MRKMISGVMLAAALLAGCSSSPSTPAAEPSLPGIVATLQAAAASAAAAPKCAALFKAGAKVTVTGGRLTCADPDGNLVGVAVARCNDGTHLGSIEPSSGAPRGWFLAPGPFVVVKGELAADKGYGAAYTKCNA